jgi:alpha-tubulin suppressor-like RCC1 family protein
MKSRLSWLLCTLAACTSSAGDARDDRFVGDGKADGFISEGSPEALGVLAVVNTLSTDELDDVVGLDGRAAINITRHRDGATASASDDDLFDTLTELDAVSYVGPVAFGKLLDYAKDNGFIVKPTASSLPTIALPDSGPKESQSWACGIDGGSLKCWGRNWYGTLGDGTVPPLGTNTVYEPQMVPGLTGVTSVTGGAKFVVALAGGDVYWWGRDPFANIASTSPLELAGLSGIKAITAGSTHACALQGDDTVSCWGHNGDGALGDGTKTARSTPATVPGLANIAAISAGGYHTCALANSGEVWCWGENNYGQVGDTGGAEVLSPQLVSDVTDATAIAAGSTHTCALRSDGKVVCWGGIYAAAGVDGDFYPISGVHNAVAISAGYAHTCALESTGEVVCWGWNGLGQLGMSTAGCAWDTNGLCPAKNGSGHVVTQVSNAVEISAKGGGTCARTADDHITCWGSLSESLASTGFKTW